MKNIKPTVLVILDGFGYRKEKEFNAIATAQTPTLTYLFQTYPHTLLQAAGKAVGLLPEYMGNSEVGHLTIGSGRVIPQPITIIHKAIATGAFFKNPLLTANLQRLARSGKCLHLMGLLSDAGVHSHIQNLYALLDAAVENGITNIAVHAFLDGRDTPPQSAEKYLEQLSKKLIQLNYGCIASIHGRFYAMDRDKNWERTEKSYRALTQINSLNYTSWETALHAYYAQEIYDEFIPPTPLTLTHTIHPDDGIIFFNIRPDRARQLACAFIDPGFHAFERKKIPLIFFITPVPYATELKTIALYNKPTTPNTLKEVLAQHNKSMFTIAETEKYAHVTYFFNGGKENILPNEIRILIPSIPTKNYIDLPKMSAPLITQAVLNSLANAPKDFYLINYANADMVGHSGNFEATVKAIECLDQEIKKLYDAVVQKMDGTLYITADHGNAEYMFDIKTNQPHTAHTVNPVPFMIIRKELTQNTHPLPLTQLADIAPFILQNMGIAIPPHMKR
ncbi:2,3-bisphosphoglycerate-independent phosphoglycerate mutase [Candidatus Dependentiae bacterium HGW-Dependentiae-1]|nr:MAG: 2,3-bisphosphoglycerate-independent phosphoglycerate mutase [Candidatus Dependentiae bacterium HGW-Dependentiae-1]